MAKLTSHLASKHPNFKFGVAISPDPVDIEPYLVKVSAVDYNASTHYITASGAVLDFLRCREEDIYPKAFYGLRATDFVRIPGNILSRTARYTAETKKRLYLKDIRAEPPNGSDRNIFL